MTHHHDHSPLIGAIIGGISGIYKAAISVVAVVTVDGLIETGIYAIVGSALGAIVSFWVHRLQKRLFKK